MQQIRLIRKSPGLPGAPRRLPPLLRQAWYGMNQAFRRRLAHLHLTPDQFTVLRILQESDGRAVKQSELTRLMSSDPNTVASLLDRMETAGLLQRRAHHRDGRALTVHLQSAGLRVYRQARTIALSLQRELLAALPVNRRTDFLESLTLLAAACQNAAQTASRNGAAPGNGGVRPVKGARSDGFAV